MQMNIEREVINIIFTLWCNNIHCYSAIIFFISLKIMMSIFFFLSNIILYCYFILFLMLINHCVWVVLFSTVSVARVHTDTYWYLLMYARVNSPSCDGRHGHSLYPLNAPTRMLVYALLNPVSSDQIVWSWLGHGSLPSPLCRLRFRLATKSNSLSDYPAYFE